MIHNDPESVAFTLCITHTCSRKQRAEPDPYQQVFNNMNYNSTMEIGSRDRQPVSCKPALDNLTTCKSVAQIIFLSGMYFKNSKFIVYLESIPAPIWLSIVGCSLKFCYFGKLIHLAISVQTTIKLVENHVLAISMT